MRSSRPPSAASPRPALRSSCSFAHRMCAGQRRHRPLNPVRRCMGVWPVSGAASLSARRNRGLRFEHCRWRGDQGVASATVARVFFSPRVIRRPWITGWVIAAGRTSALRLVRSRPLAPSGRLAPDTGRTPMCASGETSAAAFGAVADSEIWKVFAAIPRGDFRPRDP